MWVIDAVNTETGKHISGCPVCYENKEMAQYMACKIRLLGVRVTMKIIGDKRWQTELQPK